MSAHNPNEAYPSKLRFKDHTRTSTHNPSEVCTDSTAISECNTTTEVYPDPAPKNSNEVFSTFVSKNEIGQYKCLLCLNCVSESQYYAQRHFAHAHFNHSVNYRDRTIFMCKKGCLKKGHYHCPCGCQKAYEKKGDFIKHSSSKSLKAANNQFSLEVIKSSSAGVSR